MRILPCTHRPPCPGCPRYGERGIAAETAGLLATLAQATGAQLDPVTSGLPLGFRVRARLAVRGRASSPKIGIFQEGTHTIVDIPSCTIHHPSINAAGRAVREAIRRTGTMPYAERPHIGLLRYVQVVVERSTRRMQITLVTNDTSEQSVMPLAAILVSTLGQRLQGLWWNGQPERSNAILGPHWKLLAGEPAVRESIAGAEVFFPPGAFGQSSLDLAERLVADVHSRVPDDEVVAELYCGVGAIGLGLVERARDVRFNEVSPHGLEGLVMGLTALPLRTRAKTVVVPGDAAVALDMLRGATTVIVDPPRKGLDAAVVARLRAERPARLIYVSCDLASLNRDVAALCEDGMFELGRLTPYALFPYTAHVETIAELHAR